VERAIVADEMTTVSPQVYEQLQNLLAGVTVDTVPHEEFKQLTRSARAVVRTGEFTPYANVILVSGVVF
jgi:D-ribose pyranase